MAPTKERSRWLCKSCVHERTGKPWVNNADRLKCYLCQLHKSACFGGVPESAAPSTRQASGGQDKAQKPQKLNPWTPEAKELEQLRKKVQKLEAAQQSGAGPKATAAAVAGAGEDVDMEGATDEYARQRLQDLDREIAAAGKHSGQLWAHLKSELEDERTRLRAKLLESKPIHARVRTVTARLESAEKQLQKFKESVGKQRVQLGELLQKIAQADSDICEQELEIKHLALQRSSLAQQAAGEAASQPLAAIGLDKTKLGSVLQACGLGEQGATVVDAIMAELPNIVTNATLVPAGVGSATGVALAPLLPSTGEEAPPSALQAPAPPEAAVLPSHISGPTIDALSNAELRTLMGTVLPPAQIPLEDSEMRETATKMFHTASRPRAAPSADAPY